MIKRRIAALALAGLLAGCGDPDKVMFVTSASLGIDFDSKPPAASIGYDRIEGYLGPRYANGAVPPVFATIETDGALFTPSVRQVYATGDAAKIVSGRDDVKTGDRPLAGERELMFFGTSTTTGVKIGFTTGIPDSFLFGYKRKELSYIPLGKDSSGADAYPSVLATLDTTVKADQPQTSGLITRQVFATGLAAETMAADPSVRALFEHKLLSAFEEYRSAVEAQEAAALPALRCLAGVAQSDLPRVFKNAQDLKLLGDDKTYAAITSTWNAATAANPPDEARVRTAKKIYAASIAVTVGKDANRAAALKSHADFVCGLARS